MKLIKVEKTNEKVIITLLLGKTNITEHAGVRPETVHQLNNVIFKDKEEALLYWKGNRENNENQISDAISRLGQLPTGPLKEVNEFAAAIEKSGALNRRVSKRVESLLGKWNTMMSLEKLIKDIEQNNVDIKEIVEAIEAV